MVFELKVGNSFHSSRLPGQSKLMSLEMLKCQKTFKGNSISTILLLPLSLIVEADHNFCFSDCYVENDWMNYIIQIIYAVQQIEDCFHSDVTMNLFIPDEMKNTSILLLVSKLENPGTWYENTPKSVSCKGETRHRSDQLMLRSDVSCQRFNLNAVG